MPEPQITFTRAEVLAIIQSGPVRHADLARSKSHQVRRRLRPIVDDLQEAGEIRVVTLDGFPHYVSADWKLTDEHRLQLILNRCRPAHGCMVWTGHIDPSRGPMSRFLDESPMPARRAIWQVKRGPLGYQQTVRMQAGCDEACVEYTHMKLGRRDDPAKGKNITMLHRRRIATALQQSRSKLDWEKVRAIRASNEDNEVLAGRYGVSKATIGQVRREETWREFGGMFTALMPGRAAA